MQHHSGRLRWTVLPVALRVVGVGVFCIAALSFLAFHPAPRTSAASLSRPIRATVASSPSAGPVGTTISVSGSGWNEADGTPVSFGYEAGSTCSIVSDAQNGSITGGSFSGWFRWPSGTPLGTYQVCTVIENVMTVAGSFSLLSSSPPAVAISPSTLAPGTRATITASNYYPTGTSVNFLWMSGNTIIKNLNSVASDANGDAILTFSVPELSIASGSYSLAASAGNGQPPALFSSTSFTYSAPVVSPSPTPRPSPSPTPSSTMTPGVTPTPMTTPKATSTTKASATATPTSPAASTSPTAGSSQTPTTNGTNSGNSGNTSTGASAPGSLNHPLLIGGISILSGALLIGMMALLLNRRRKAARAGATVMPVGPGLPGQAPPLNLQGVPAYNGAIAAPPNTGLPDNSNPFSYPLYHPVSAPVLAGAGVVAGNGNAAAPAAQPGPDMMPPVPVPPQSPAWLTNPSRGSAPATISVTADPALEALRLQAQSGLLVLPRPFKGERSQ